MFIQPYQLGELHFAYCYRVYFRWQTLRNISCRPLAQINAAVLTSLTGSYGVVVLECSASDTEVRTMVSLQPRDSISATAGKLKGRVTKWLNERMGTSEPLQLLSRGYFACTAGKSRREAVEQYLDKQSTHHGYDKRPLPPIFVERYELNAADEARLTAKHAYVVAQFHVVLVTNRRRGVLGSHEGRAIAAEWRRRQEEMRIAIVKVSFIPDHVHLAVRLHPAVSPAEVVAALMNAAQNIVQNLLVREGLECLWQKSAYLGSYGDLASPQIRKYIRRRSEDL